MSAPLIPSLSNLLNGSLTTTPVNVGPSVGVSDGGTWETK